VATRRKLIIAAIGAALLASLPPTALAVFPGNNGEILFVSGRDTGGDAEADIYIIDGPNDTTLFGPTDFVAGQHRHPAWSADARSIVFAVRVADTGCPTSAPPNTDEDLYFYDRTGIGGTTIFEPSADCVLEDHPTFSPDGEKIAYESEVTNGSGQKDILIANADGSGTPDNFTNSSGIVEESPVWSPDGKFIYYARRTTAATESDIYRHRADGGSAQPILGLMSATNEFQPEISPDGRRLCYTFGAFGSPAADVMVARVNGAGDPFELSPADTNVADYDCGWSPNGKRIAWTRGAFGSGDLQFAPPIDQALPAPYGNNSGTFDGNVDWAPIPGKCDGRHATIAGGPGADDLVGTPGKDVIVTFEGNDRVKGKGGNDRICGGKGSDTVSGVSGKDRLFSGPGPDKLNGGPDKDRCDGGPGNDVASGCEKRTSI
jgi:RTX calcium-binding nonapeptide repeat (4 copies)/WD40-like Beta Propeller Repeat